MYDHEEVPPPSATTQSTMAAQEPLAAPPTEEGALCTPPAGIPTDEHCTCHYTHAEVRVPRDMGSEETAENMKTIHASFPGLKAMEVSRYDPGEE